MSYAALDILIPLHPANIPILETCLQGLDRNQPGCIYRVILALDGAAKSDRTRVSEIMRQRKPQRTPNPIGQPGAHQMVMSPPKDPPDWIVVDWPGSVYWGESVTNGMTRIQAEWLLILPPWIEFRDARWFGKLQQPFMAARGTMLVCPSPTGIEANTQQPSQLRPRRVPGTDFGLMQTKTARHLIPLVEKASPREMVDSYATMAEQRSGLRWVAPSVRYFVIDHVPHAPCTTPAKSKQETPPPPPSVSRSRTTRVSSSPTTTDQGGSEDSVPF